jgi:prolyl oligopeptidase
MARLLFLVLSISEDGNLMAYGLIHISGSDWNEWKVRDVETGVDLPII